MPTTQERLDAYYAAEAKILQRGQRGSVGNYSRDNAELAEIRKAITQLQTQLTLERSGGSSLRYATAVFCNRNR